MSAFDHVVTNIEELRGVVEAPPPAARPLLKERTTLDAHCRAFIAHSPFLLIATAEAGGRCDVSPKGDAPGFVQVIDDRRLAIRIGLAKAKTSQRDAEPTDKSARRFDLPRARPRRKPAGQRPGVDYPRSGNSPAFSRNGKTPSLAIGVEIEQCFFHCAKALLTLFFGNQ